MPTLNGETEVVKLQRTPKGISSVEKGCFKSWLGHPSEASINRIAANLTDLERCVADLCELRERCVHCKAPLKERELLALDAVIGRWATLWKQLYGDVGGQTPLWSSTHLEKVIRKCLQRGHAAFLWLAVLALNGHRHEQDTSHRELLLAQSLVESISACLVLYEAWCLLKHKHAPTDIDGELAKTIAMQSLAWNTRANEGYHEPPKLFSNWLLLTVYRRCLSDTLDEFGAMRLTNEVIGSSSNDHQMYGSNKRDPGDTILLLSIEEGCIYFGINGDLRGAGHDYKFSGWMLPWEAVFAPLHSSGNKDQLLPLLSATVSLKARRGPHIACNTQAGRDILDQS